MKQNRLVLPFLIILLVLVLPFTIIGVGNKIYMKIVGENPRHLHKIDNRLYFYDNSNKYVGYYDCENANCDNAMSVLDDTDFYYYQEAKPTQIGLLNNEFALIQDGDKLILQDVSANRHIADFMSVKNYGTLIANTYYIIQNMSGKYGLFDTQSLRFNIDAEYDFMGISDSMINMTKEGLIVAVRKDNTWYLLNNADQNIAFTSNNPIINYDEQYVYTRKNGQITISTYKGQSLLPTKTITDIDWCDKYTIITTKNGNILIYQSLSELPLIEYVNKGKGLNYRITDEAIIISDDNNEIGSFSLIDTTEKEEEEIELEE